MGPNHLDVMVNLIQFTSKRKKFAMHVKNKVTDILKLNDGTVSSLEF